MYRDNYVDELFGGKFMGYVSIVMDAYILWLK